MGESAPSGEGCRGGLTRDSPQESGVWSWAPPTFLEVGGHSPRRPPRLAEALGGLPTILPPLLLTNMGHGQQRAGLASALLPPGCLPLVPSCLLRPALRPLTPAASPGLSQQPPSAPCPFTVPLPTPPNSIPSPPRLCPPPPPPGATTSSPQSPLGLQSLSSITLPSAHSLTHPQCPSLLSSKTPGPAPIPPALPDPAPVDLSLGLSSCPPPPLCLHQPGPGHALLKSTTLPPSGLCPLCFHWLLLQLS